MGYKAEYVQCDLCSYKWVVVYEEDVNKLECSNCKNIVYFEIISM